MLYVKIIVFLYVFEDKAIESLYYIMILIFERSLKDGNGMHDRFVVNTCCHLLP